MKRSTKTLIALIFPLVICHVAIAWAKTDKENNYSVIALKNCQVVSDQAMTVDQFAAFLSLKQKEQKMHSLEVPIQKIEQEIKVYTDELTKLTSLAIQDTDESIHINKKLLEQQEKVAKELNQFMQQHQQDFDALGKQGRIIGLQAEVFENSIKTSLESIDYDQIKLLTPVNRHSLANCDKSIQVMVL
jgi:hypothetical protein